jgi:hypothetical protein
MPEPRGASVELPPILNEPGESRYEMFALAPEGRGGWPIDPLRAREMEDKGCRLFTRQVTTTDWGEVTTYVDGKPSQSGDVPPPHEDECPWTDGDPLACTCPPLADGTPSQSGDEDAEPSAADFAEHYMPLGASQDGEGGESRG